jgi:cyanophycinase
VAETPAGSLALIGGRLEESNVAVFAEMRRLAGGRVLVFPTASAEPKAVGEESLQVFRAHGFEGEVAPLTPRNAARLARDPELIARVADYGSVYFTGGDQANIVSSLAPGGRETPLLAAIRAARAAGGMVAGSSAGAAVMSRRMLLGGTSIEAVVHGVAADPEKAGLLLGDGLGFFQHGMVDQHFIKRGRLGRLVVAMAAAGVRRGFGVDENTALLVEGDSARVCGEYGVMLVDLGPGRRDPGGRSFEGFRLSYLDDGDSVDLRRFRPVPGAAKRRVRKREIAYRAPARSRRNVFGAYTLYDLMARLVLGDPESGLRMSALNFRCSITSEHLSATRLADRIGSRARTFGMTPNPEARIVLLGSSPIGADPLMLEAPMALLGAGPVGVFAAASAEARRTAAEHVALLARHGVHAIDLGVTIDTVDYAAQNHELLEDIAGLRGVLFCGGNQIRLVETLLHRGEESAVLRAIARAHAQGAVLIAASGAASALSGVMIAGGSSWEALRYGVSSDTGHRGLVIQEGIGLFAGGIVDQNLLGGNRLGRLVVGCAEEGERFGVGVFEDSAVVASHAGTRLHATGKSGFVLVEVDLTALELQSDSFAARGVRLTVLGPGDGVDIAGGGVEREAAEGPAAALLARLIDGLAKEAGRRRAGHRGLEMRVHDVAGAAALLDLEFPRDEGD